jgi:hypothetical protein
MEAFLEAGLNERELFIAGLMLYWGEGAKVENCVSVTNSDPAIIRFFVLWFERCLNIEIPRLRATVHLYPDVDIDQAESYWSEVIGIPRSQFYKAQVDIREGKLVDKRGKLKYGTIHLEVRGEGTLDLQRRVLIWIETLADHVK